MKNSKREQGFASIIIASIMMVILTLVAVGLSRLMQREERQSLDRQLSTQAFYAAETGVNDIQARLQSGVISNTAEKNDCDVTDLPEVGNNGVIDPANPEVAYTCLKWDPTPTALDFSNGSITTQKSRVFPVRSENGGNIKSIKFEWSGADSNKTIIEDCTSGPYDLIPARSNSVPILRVDLVRMPTAGPYSRNDFIDQTITAYLYPQTTCGSTSAALSTFVGASRNAQIVSVDCNPSNAYACSFDFTAIETGLPASDRYFIRLKSIYNNADVRVTATGTNGAEFEFVGAQTIIDSTGKARDVLRRIKVNVSNAGSYPLPEYVLQSLDGVCKRLNVANASRVSDACTFN